MIIKIRVKDDIGQWLNLDYCKSASLCTTLPEGVIGEKYFIRFFMSDGTTPESDKFNTKEEALRFMNTYEV